MSSFFVVIVYQENSDYIPLTGSRNIFIEEISMCFFDLQNGVKVIKMFIHVNLMNILPMAQGISHVKGKCIIDSSWLLTFIMRSMSPNQLVNSWDCMV